MQPTQAGRNDRTASRNSIDCQISFGTKNFLLLLKETSKTVATFTLDGDFFS